MYINCKWTYETLVIGEESWSYCKAPRVQGFWALLQLCSTLPRGGVRQVIVLRLNTVFLDGWNYTTQYEIKTIFIFFLDKIQTKAAMQTYILSYIIYLNVHNHKACFRSGRSTSNQLACQAHVPLSTLATSASLGVTARMLLVTKAGDLVSVFVFVFLFTARMPLVTRIGDLDSVFVFVYLSRQGCLWWRGQVILFLCTENPRGSIWTGLSREYLLLVLWTRVFEEPFMIKMGCISVSYRKPMIGSYQTLFNLSNIKYFYACRYASIQKEVVLPLVESKECQQRLRKTRLGKVSTYCHIRLAKIYHSLSSWQSPNKSPQFFELHSSFVCAGGKGQIDTCQVRRKHW